MRGGAMPHTDAGHKILDILEHIWPYVTTVFVIISTGVTLWWTDRKQIKKDIAEQRRLILWLKDNSVTYKDLHACREDVREVDDNNLEKIFTAFDEERKLNRTEHNEIKNMLIDSLKIKQGGNYERMGLFKRG